MQLGNQVEKSLVNIAAVSTDTDWFDETYTTQNSVCGTVVGDNGVELLILTEYAEISNGDQLLVTFLITQLHQERSKNMTETRD